MGFETDWVLHRFVVRSAPSRLLAKEWGIDHGFLNYARRELRVFREPRSTKSSAHLMSKFTGPNN